MSFRILSAVLFLFAFGSVDLVEGQVASLPSSNCHVTDGQFTPCPNGATEWSDVAPLPFPLTNSYLYVNQDAAHAFLYLMYDFTFRTSPIAVSESVTVSFDTVEQGSSGASLEHYDISIFGDRRVEVVVNGLVEAPGRIAGAVGFSASPNSAIPHLLAELQVPLTPGIPTTYSPDPIFWSATTPPTPPPPPPPPGQKTQAQKDALLNMADAKQAAGIIMAVGCILIPSLPARVACAAAAAALNLNAIRLRREARSDPSDPNFTVIFTPAVYSLPAQVPGDGLTAEEAAAFNTFSANVTRTIALEEAIFISINRAQGAHDAGNAFWEGQQLQAAKSYEAQLAPLVQAEPGIFAALGDALKTAGIAFTVTKNDVLLYQSSLAAGLSLSDIQTLAQLGAQSSQDLTEFVQSITTVDPAGPASLGTGLFPDSLSDPSLLSAATVAAFALNQEAKVPPTNSLTHSFTTTIPGDYVAAGVGLRGKVNGNIVISSIPAGAVVQKAFLYWGFLDTGESPTLKQLTFNGTPITGTLLGTGPDTCWGRSNSFTYRSDVTPFVAGDGTYNITGVATGGLILAEGASLVVIYQLPGTPFKNVMLADGNVVFPAVSLGTTSFSDFTAAGPVSAATTFMVGDGQATQFNLFTPVSFTGSLGTLNFPGLFASRDGLLWDTATFDVSSVIGTGSSSGSATIQLAGDCLLWSAQAFSVTTAPVTPSPVTATAAVVKTTAAGDTVVNGRGLTPNDAPTIKDKIEMIVVNRAIEGRTNSASDLTTQLVNSIPPNILPPSQAAGVIQAVIKDLVPIDKTPPVILGMPAAGCSLWPPNHEMVQVATVTATDLLSGVAPGSFNVTGTSNESSDSTDPDIVVTPNGLGGFAVYLRAERLGTGTGRTYTVTATATDLAGNTAVTTSTCTVSHDQGH